MSHVNVSHMSWWCLIVEKSAATKLNSSYWNMFATNNTFWQSNLLPRWVVQSIDQPQKGIDQPLWAVHSELVRWLRKNIQVFVAQNKHCFTILDLLEDVDCLPYHLLNIQFHSLHLKESHRKISLNSPFQLAPKLLQLSTLAHAK